MSMQQVTEAQANPEVVINRNSQTVEHASVYGQRQSAHSGLTWGYYGGPRWGGNATSNGVLTLADDATNYIVVERATGAISVSTSTTNWDNTTDYARVYKVVVADGVVTNNGGSDFDYRSGPFGVHGQSTDTGGGSSDAADINIADAGTYFTGTDVEAALQEIGADLASIGAGGDASTNTSSSVDSEVALFSGTGGKTLKRATGTGFVRLASGVQSTVDGSNDDFAQRKSGVWTNRTVAQVSADLQGTGLLTDAVGFRTIPQNSQSTAYTTVAADAGKHLLHPSGDANARTFTIDSNANVAYPVGTAITFINETSQVLSIAITSDTLTLANSTTTGTRSLAQNGVATAIKVTSTKWIISGSGLT